MRMLAALLAVCLLALTATACGSTPQPAPTVTVTVTALPSPDELIDAMEADSVRLREETVREGVRIIQIGLQSWAIDHDDAYPDPELVNEADMAGYYDAWPTNPYTGLPMENLDAPGDFSYTLTDDGGFELVGFGADGQVVITAP